ncbi:phenylalanine--tRNA ligase subunit beta [Patescibacteria group bacterium]|nr:phenylalanine--tRNA ligase subunit beta [Patescibacteria group bacterium]
MDIKLSHQLLSQFLKTNATPKRIAHALSLCGPTVDRLHKVSADTIYDVEVITNRIDSISAFGIAREAVSILPQFGYRAKLLDNPYDLTKKDLGVLPKNPPIKLTIKNQDLVQRFTCIALKNITVKPSPKSLQKILTNSGLRPLNNIIDISNELTLKYGQPVHVFDLDKIKGKTMIVRESRPGEKILTLDNKTHTLNGGDIVIEDGQGNLIDLCGIMGGGLSHIDKNTKNVLLFVQTYEPKRIRKTSLYTQQRTLASQIFEKSPDPELVLPVLIAGTKLIQMRAGGAISSNLLDIYPQPFKAHSVNLSLNWLNKFAGITLKKQVVINILTDLGFKITSPTKNKLICQVPSWRTHDIKIKQDLAEEIIRIYGYFRLPSILPTSMLENTTPEKVLETEKKLKHKLSSLSFTEIYNPSLVSKQLFAKAKMDINPSLKLTNPLSNQHEYLRRSLIPSLLQNTKDNQDQQKEPLYLFELANIYLPRGEKDLPEEKPILTMTTNQIDFRHHKGLVESLMQKLNIKNLKFKPLDHDSLIWNINSSAHIYSGNKYLGLIGKPSPQVQNNFELTGEIFISNLDVSVISTLSSSIHHGKPLSKYPPVIEDLTVSSNQPIGDLIKKIKSTSKLITKVVYQESYNNKHTFKLHFSHPKKSLTQKQVNQLKTKLLKATV